MRMNLKGFLFPIEKSRISSMEIPAAIDPSPGNYIDIVEDWSLEEESVIEEDDDACVAV